MTESNQIWVPVRRALAPFGRIQRFENRLESGWPDVVYTLCGVTGWIELKLIPSSGRCPEHLTREQVIWAEEEIRVGGRWHLLGKRGKAWVLMTAPQTRAWFDGSPLETIINAERTFPKTAILKELVK